MVGLAASLIAKGFVFRDFEICQRGQNAHFCTLSDLASMIHLISSQSLVTLLLHVTMTPVVATVHSLSALPVFSRLFAQTLCQEFSI